MYKKRGGYCPDSIRFVEDVAHGLHISTEAAAEKEKAAFNAALPENEPQEIEEEEEEVEEEEEEVEEEETEKRVKEDEEESKQENEENGETEMETNSGDNKNNEENNETQEDAEDISDISEIIPKQKNSLKKIEILPGLFGVPEMIAAKGPHINRMVVRGCKAMSSGSFMKHLKMSEEVACFAISSFLNAEDSVMRAAIIEACLNGATLDDLDENELLDSQYIHSNRTRVIKLIDRMKLEDYDLAQDLKTEAELSHSEKARYINLVQIAEAVAEPREFELMEMQGISRTIDEKHRYALAAIIDVCLF